MDITQIRLVAKVWYKKRVEDLRVAAVLEESGVAFDAVRVGVGGPRMCLAVCATGHDQIGSLREDWGLTGAAASADWHALSAGDLVLRAVRSPGGWAFAALDGNGEWLALYLVAVVPDSITILERGFGIAAT